MEALNCQFRAKHHGGVTEEMDDKSMSINNMSAPILLCDLYSLTADIFRTHQSLTDLAESVIYKYIWTTAKIDLGDCVLVFEYLEHSKRINENNSIH